MEDHEYPLPLRDYTPEFEAALEDAINAADRLTDYWGSDDWMDLIDKGRLDMFNVNKCVIGQLGEGNWAYSYKVGCQGFIHRREIYNYGDLTNAWLEIL